MLEKQIEEERGRAAIDSTRSILYSLQKNKDISPDVSKQLVKKFERKISILHNDVEKEFEMEVLKVIKPIAAENRVRSHD